MTCLYGGEPKFPNDSTITFDPYEGLNTQAQFFLTLAGVASPMTFDPQELCSSAPPTVQTITIEDFAFPATLKDKVENNARAAAWFKGCQCKPKPANPEPPTDPTPPDLPAPDAPPPLPFNITCGSQREASAWVIQFQIYDRQDNTLVPNLIQSEYPFATYPNLVVERDSPTDETFAIRNDGNSVDRQPPAFSNRIGHNYKIIFCEGLEQPPVPEPEFPPFPDFCPPQEGNDCLKQPDKAEIISELKLWISESNDRIRDEIGGYIYSSKEEQLADSSSRYNLLSAKITAESDSIRELLSTQYGALTALIELLEPYIDGAKNQILAGIAASTATIGAGLVAATTTISTAIAASTTTISSLVTSSLAATQTALSNLINQAKENIQTKIEDEGKKNNYERLVVRVSIQSYPSNLAVTAGRDGSPDRLAFGWITFYRTMPNGTRFYFERQFINFVRTTFVSETNAENVGFVCHFQPNVVGLTESEIKRFTS